MNKIAEVLGTKSGKIAAAVSGAGLVLLVPAAAGADTISSAFTTETTTLTGYLGDAAVMVIALTGIAVGIKLFRRWTNRAAAT